MNKYLQELLEYSSSNTKRKRKAFAEGFLSAFDVFGIQQANSAQLKISEVILEKKINNSYSKGFQEDKRALQVDAERIGKDFQIAMQRYLKEEYEPAEE